MSKTYKDVVKLFDTTKAKKRESGASARFKREKLRRDEAKLHRFTTWLERTAPQD
jgi:hypothetical protein